MEFYEINGYPNYRLVRESERDFYVISNQKGDWERIGTDDGTGHISMALYNNGIRRATTLHTLIAEIFIPNPEGKTVVHHIDGDASNNDPTTNLMWVTAKEHSQIHANDENCPMHTEEARKKNSETHIGLQAGEKNPFYGKHHSEESRRKISNALKGRTNPKRYIPVDELELDGITVIKRHDSISAAAMETGINRANISACCRGKLKTAGKRKWRYAK